MLRQTNKNSFLISGDLNDFVILYNSSPKSPHIVKNLRGQFDFDGSHAKACLYEEGFGRGEIYLLRRTLQGFHLKSIDIDIDQAECNRTNLLSYDVIGIKRGAFLRLKAEFSLPILSEIENDRFKHLMTVTHEELERDRVAKEKARAQIKDDIEHEARDGFGIVIINNKVPALCLIASQKVRAHKKWIDDHIDRLSTEANISSINEMPNLEDAYEASQRNECGAIYASTSALKDLFGALAREGKSYSVASLWVNLGQIDELENAIDKAQTENAARLQRQKEELEGARRLAEAQRREGRIKREQREKELRAHYGKVASAAAAAIANEVRRAFDANIDWQNTSAFKEFPNTIYSYHNLLQSRWELQTFNSDVFDYGTADWKGRNLEAAFVEVKVRLRNRILGEYKDICLVFGRINDAEFAMKREGIGTTCSDKRQLSDWRRGHRFQSLWFAE